MNRRVFLHQASLGVAGFLLSGLIFRKNLFARERLKKQTFAEHLIWINLQGAASQIDTFDAKPNHKNGGSFKAIPAALPNVQFSEHLPKLAEYANRFSLIRSMTSKEGNHDRARHLIHTGYAPQGAVQQAALGSILWKEKGKSDFDLPHFVAINRPGAKAGLLGVQYEPFFVQNPLKPIENLGDSRLSAKEVQSRLKLLAQLDLDFEKRYASQEARQHQDIYAKANRMVNSPLAKAFDVSEESETMRNAYGTTEFGQGCLMARRLIEAGVKTVEVSLDGWDTHANNFQTLKEKLCPDLDAGLSALILDLEQRALLDKTLVVCATEFGRTPRINKDEGRDHFPNAFSILLAGGGIKSGKVVGETSSDGLNIVSEPITVPDLYATLFRCFGIEGDKLNYTKDGRPIRLVDKSAKAIEKILFD